MDIDLAVEKLSLSGTILVNLTLNAAAPFPHAIGLSVSFVEKPDVWFSVRILRAVQMMEMPLIKTWIHAVVTDALASWLVDPGHLEMDLRARERPGPGLDSVTNSMPQGVLTVVLCQNGCSGKCWLARTPFLLRSRLIENLINQYVNYIINSIIQYHGIN
jgi:hypothetical protein